MKNNYYITCITDCQTEVNMLIACLQQESSTSNAHRSMILCQKFK